MQANDSLTDAAGRSSRASPLPAESASPRIAARDGTAALDSQQARHITITTGTSLAAGLIAFLGGALAVGAAHYMGSTKALAEEGIDPRIRLRAVPVAFQALAISTAFCGAAGIAGFIGLHAGLRVRSESRVSSWQDAIALARREREVVQAEFRARLSGEHTDHDASSKP